MRLVTILSVLMLGAAADGQSIVTPLFVHKDGEADDYPAYYVNWYDAALYCNARTKLWGSTDTVYRYSALTGTPGNGCVLEGLSIDLSKSGYRLPTEAQWEYACRAGTTTDYYWGTASADEYAWHFANSGSTTHPVAHTLPNAFGLYDMCGNVLEWCNDWFDQDYYNTSPSTDPTGPVSGTARVIRGGGWNTALASMYSARRDNEPPATTDFFFSSMLGMRTVLPAR